MQELVIFIVGDKSSVLNSYISQNLIQTVPPSVVIRYNIRFAKNRFRSSKNRIERSVALFNSLFFSNNIYKRAKTSTDFH